MDAEPERAMAILFTTASLLAAPWLQLLWRKILSNGKLQPSSGTIKLLLVVFVIPRQLRWGGKRLASGGADYHTASARGSRGCFLLCVVHCWFARADAVWASASPRIML